MVYSGGMHDWIAYPFVRRAVDLRTSFVTLIWVMVYSGGMLGWIAYPFVRRAMDQRTSFATLMKVLFHFPAALETVVSACCKMKKHLFLRNKCF